MYNINKNKKVDWKPNVQYFTHMAGYIKNNVPNNSPAFKPRPMRHYRKQYQSTNSSSFKYNGNYLGMYTIPGGNILSMKSSSSKCIGVSGIANHRLNYRENKNCYTNKNCNKIKHRNVIPVSSNNSNKRQFSRVRISITQNSNFLDPARAYYQQWPIYVNRIKVLDSNNNPINVEHNLVNIDKHKEINHGEPYGYTGKVNLIKGYYYPYLAEGGTIFADISWSDSGVTDASMILYKPPTTEELSFVGGAKGVGHARMWWCMGVLDRYFKMYDIFNGKNDKVAVAMHLEVTFDIYTKSKSVIVDIPLVYTRLWKATIIATNLSTGDEIGRRVLYSEYGNSAELNETIESQKFIITGGSWGWVRITILRDSSFGGAPNPLRVYTINVTNEYGEPIPVTNIKFPQSPGNIIRLYDTGLGATGQGTIIYTGSGSYNNEEVTGVTGESVTVTNVNHTNANSNITFEGQYFYIDTQNFLTNGEHYVYQVRDGVLIKSGYVFMWSDTGPGRWQTGAAEGQWKVGDKIYKDSIPMFNWNFNDTGLYVNNGFMILMWVYIGSNTPDETTIKLIVDGPSSTELMWYTRNGDNYTFMGTDTLEVDNWYYFDLFVEPGGYNFTYHYRKSMDGSNYSHHTIKTKSSYTMASKDLSDIVIGVDFGAGIALDTVMGLRGDWSYMNDFTTDIFAALTDIEKYNTSDYQASDISFQWQISDISGDNFSDISGETDYKIHIPSDQSMINKYVRVKVTKDNDNGIYGKIISHMPATNPSAGEYIIGTSNSGFVRVFESVQIVGENTYGHLINEIFNTPEIDDLGFVLGSGIAFDINTYSETVKITYESSTGLGGGVEGDRRLVGAEVKAIDINTGYEIGSNILNGDIIPDKNYGRLRIEPGDHYGSSWIYIDEYPIYYGYSDDNNVYTQTVTLIPGSLVRGHQGGLVIPGEFDRDNGATNVFDNEVSGRRHKIAIPNKFLNGLSGVNIKITAYNDASLAAGAAVFPDVDTTDYWETTLVDIEGISYTLYTRIDDNIHENTDAYGAAHEVAYNVYIITTSDYNWIEHYEDGRVVEKDVKTTKFTLRKN